MQTVCRRRKKVLRMSNLPHMPHLTKASDLNVMQTATHAALTNYALYHFEACQEGMDALWAVDRETLMHMLKNPFKHTKMAKKYETLWWEEVCVKGGRARNVPQLGNPCHIQDLCIITISNAEWVPYSADNHLDICLSNVKFHIWIDLALMRASSITVPFSGRKRTDLVC